MEIQNGAATLKHSWQFFKKLHINVPYNPAILLLGIYTQEKWKDVYTKACTGMATAALFMIAKNWKQPQCPSTNEWKKMWYIHTMEYYAAAAAAKPLQSCPTLCDPIDGSPPGSPVHGILQARTLEWVAISFSNAGKWKVKVKSLSRVWLLATPWTAAHQAPPSMGFSRQECWSRVPLPSP